MSAGTEHPVFKNDEDVDKSSARQGLPLRLPSIATVGALDLSDSYILFVDGKVFERAFSVLTPDGVNTIADRVGNLFRWVTGDAYDIPWNATRGLGASEFLGQHVFIRNVTFEDDFEGSWGYARVAAAAEKVIPHYRVRDNVSTLIGNVIFPAGLKNPVFEDVGESLEFIPQDILQAFAPASADALLADVAWTLAGRR